MATNALAVELEPHVDAVARRAGHFADDHPLGLGQRVDERALADVAAADDGHLHHRLADLERVVVQRRRQAARRSCSSSTARLRFWSVLIAQRLAAAEPVELVGLRVERLGVGLVGHADDRARRRSAAAGRPPGRAAAGPRGCRRRTGSPSAESMARLICSSMCCGQVVGVVEADAAGVDQLEEAVVVAHQVRERGRG